VERTGHASEPARPLGLRRLRRAGDGPFSVSAGTTKRLMPPTSPFTPTPPIASLNVQLTAALAKTWAAGGSQRPLPQKFWSCIPLFDTAANFAGVDCAPALAASMAQALQMVGLPEYFGPRFWSASGAVAGIKQCRKIARACFTKKRKHRATAASLGSIGGGRCGFPQNGYDTSPSWADCENRRPRS